MGSQAALARHLEVSSTVLGTWLNFKVTPSYGLKCMQKKRLEIELKLLALVGATFDEVFPLELRSEAFKKRTKQLDHTVDVPVERLAAAGAVPQLVASPEDMISQSELQEELQFLLSTLTPREERVIKMRFGLAPYTGEHTLKEVAETMNLRHSQSVTQIETKALKKLRHPSRADRIREWITNETPQARARRLSEDVTKEPIPQSPVEEPESLETEPCIQSDRKYGDHQHAWFYNQLHPLFDKFAPVNPANCSCGKEAVVIHHKWPLSHIEIQII